MLARASVLALVQLCVAAHHLVPRQATSAATCAGYNARNVRTTPTSLSADLVLAGPCGVYGEDIQRLTLSVTYETEERLHVKIGAQGRFEVPTSVFPRPQSRNLPASRSELEFKYTASPFTFQVIRKADREVLFDTTGNPIVFEPQYLRLQTNLPGNANIYGLGEHTHSFRLPNSNVTRTLWNRDAYSVPEGSNLYSSHPVYFEHRASGTHAVFLLNSNGMDIKINQAGGKTTLEYNVIGGIFDFYFLSGSKTDPVQVSRQYAQISGLPVEQPWWAFGLHQCRYGYNNYIEVSQVVENYTLAGIPLDTMWTDIDYMHDRIVFTNDEQYFPKKRVREIIDYLHDHDQQYIVMVDPAFSNRKESINPAYLRGLELDLFVKAANGEDFKGVVWPGVTVYPSWFHRKTQQFWTNEFRLFFNPRDGWDIDGLWIDMNEAANFCSYPCVSPEQTAIDNHFPPARPQAPPPPDAPIFTRVHKRGALLKRTFTVGMEAREPEPEPETFKLSARAPPTTSLNLLEPPYSIKHDAGNGKISSNTLYTNAYHENGLFEYDTHNLYGTMMSQTSQKAMEARRPGKRTLVITRSTWVGAGASVGKWLGDNISLWEHYRKSIAGVLGFSAIYQVAMVGPDVCGFGGNTTETLCARWATLGAFYTFMRNHNELGMIPQEFYRWQLTTDAAKAALDMRYRLLDYMYTAMHRQSVDGTPVWQPLWFKYPSDSATYGIDLQFFFGDALLVSPVTGDEATSVSFYLPKGKWYDFKTFAPIEGTGASYTVTNVPFTDIPVYIRGGSILPLRATGAMTTAAVRKIDYHIVVAPDASGNASGSLYVDDGESIAQPRRTNVEFTYSRRTLRVKGQFGYNLGVKIAKVTVLGVSGPKGANIDNSNARISANPNVQTVEVTVDRPFDRDFTLTVT